MEVRQLGHVPFCTESGWHVRSDVGSTDVRTPSSLSSSCGDGFANGKCAVGQRSSDICERDGWWTGKSKLQRLRTIVFILPPRNCR